MASFQVISSDTIEARNESEELSEKVIELPPWDLVFLGILPIQDGLLFHKPCESDQTTNQIIHHLKHSLSSTLSFFPPLAGRLIMTEHDDNTISCSLACNNAGALFVHAKADNITVSDILQPNYIPPFLNSFFPLNGVRNYEGTSQPLLAVQVTELVDGFFIAIAINHVVTDGKSFWHFVNSWAEISRGFDKPTKLPSLDRWFPDGIDRPIRFPFALKEEKPPSLSRQESSMKQSPPARIFHFTKERIAELKSKANAEAGTDKISSLQALLTHLWRSMVRNQCSLDPQEELHFVISIDFRGRIRPPLPENYFGNTVTGTFVSMKAGELLDNGLGMGALEMNKMISSEAQDHVIKKQTEYLLKTPSHERNAAIRSRIGQTFFIGNSPKFDYYGNDFGWGKPVRVGSSLANKRMGNITLYSGIQEGSIETQVSLPNEVLEAMANDPEFLDPVTTTK